MTAKDREGMITFLLSTTQELSALGVLGKVDEVEHLKLLDSHDDAKLAEGVVMMQNLKQCVVQLKEGFANA